MEIYLHNRDHRVAGARYIFIWRRVFVILRNVHLLLTKWIYICGALSKGMLPMRGWGLYQGGWYSPSHLHSLPDLSFTLPVPPLPSLLPQGCTSTLIYSDDSFVPHIPGGYSGICCIYSLYLIYTVYAIYPCCPPVHKYSLLVQAMIMLCLKQIVGF